MSVVARVKAQSWCRSEPVRPLRRCHVCRAAGLEVPHWVKEISPRGPCILVKTQDAESQTVGGVLLPGSAQQRPTSGQVIKCGDGRLPGGRQQDFTVQPGDEVLFSKFGFAFTQLDWDGDEYLLLKETDIIGIMPKADAIADDIPELKPIGDRVLVKINATTNVTTGGLVLPESASEKPVSGTVVRAGPGKTNDEGEVEEISVAEGDKVVYFKYAGDQMETTDGTQYVVLHECDILCKA